MNNFMTTDEKCTGQVSVWAIPNSDYDPTDEESTPFRYELKEGAHHWRDEAIRVSTEEITLNVPSGINLVQEAIITLNSKKEKAREEYMETCKRMDDLISQLQLITHQPNPEENLTVIEVPGYDGEGDIEVVEDGA